jgi:hypothetical protein
MEENSVAEVCLLQCLHENSRWLLTAFFVVVRKPYLGDISESLCLYNIFFSIFYILYSPSVALVPQFSFTPHSVLWDKMIWMMILNRECHYVFWIDGGKSRKHYDSQCPCVVVSSGTHLWRVASFVNLAFIIVGTQLTPFHHLTVTTF